MPGQRDRRSRIPDRGALNRGRVITRVRVRPFHDVTSRYFKVVHRSRKHPAVNRPFCAACSRVPAG